MNDLTIVIPAYNEAESLRKLLPGLLQFCGDKGCRLVIVNDGSRDDTLQVLREHEGHPNFRFVNHKVNRGYGGALKSGIRAVETAYCITIDADGQHRLEDVESLHRFRAENDADMVVGSRKGQKDASLYRGVGKRLIRLFAKILMPIHIYDINSGMKIYDTALTRRYIRLCPDSMAFSDIITLTFISQRHLVLEHDITILDRTAGESTINTMTALETVRQLLNIVVLFNPMRVFLPIAAVSIMLAVGWGIYSMAVQGRGLSVGSLLGITTGIIFFLLGLLGEQLSYLRKISILED